MVVVVVVVVACAGWGDVASSSSVGISVSSLLLVKYMQKKMKKKYLGPRRDASRAPRCWRVVCHTVSKFVKP